MNPKVSIIIPNYNHALFLQERLDSVFNQTFQDFEVILLDDASTDNSLEVLKVYAKHPKVSHYIINEENSESPFKQWQKGIELAKGAYVWIAESDDYCELHFLEHCVAIMEMNKRVGLVVTAIKEQTVKETNVFKPFKLGLYNGNELLEQYMLRGNSIRNGSSVLFALNGLNTAALERLADFRICGDWWLWVNILKNYDLYFVEEPLTTYIKHDAAVTFNLRDNAKFYEESLNILKYISSLNIIAKTKLDTVILFWIDKIKSCALADLKQHQLISRFYEAYSLKKRVRLQAYKFKRRIINFSKQLFNFFKKQYHTKFGTDKDLYLVYTLSKVGSSSVYYSLKEKYPYKEIHHLHFLGETWLNRFKTDHDVFKRNLEHAQHFYNLLHSKKWNLKIISLTRDPVARDISGVFQTWQHIFNVDDITEVSFEDIIDYLSKENFSYSENWFKTDFIEFTGLNVLEESFDSNRGYKVYSTKRALILIMQLEQLDKIYDEAMNSFLGKGTYTLHKENITSNRNSGLLNKQVKQCFRLPKDKATNLYSSKYVKTFYNLAQIDIFIKKWTQR